MCGLNLGCCRDGLPFHTVDCSQDLIKVHKRYNIVLNFSFFNYSPHKRNGENNQHNHLKWMNILPTGNETENGKFL